MTTTIKSVLLYDTTLSANGIFDIQDIPQTYRHLKLVAKLRSATSTTSTTGFMLFNNDLVEGNYHGNIINRQGVSAATGGEGASPYLGQVSGATAPAGAFSSIEADIPNYANATSFLRTAISRSATIRDADYHGQQYFFTTWDSGGVTAINRLTIRSVHPNFVAQSRVLLYGIPGGSA